MKSDRLLLLKSAAGVSINLLPGRSSPPEPSLLSGIELQDTNYLSTVAGFPQTIYAPGEQQYIWRVCETGPRGVAWRGVAWRRAVKITGCN